MLNLSRIMLVAVTAVVLSGSLVAQDSQPSAAQDFKPSAEVVAFADTFGEWKDMLNELRILKDEYVGANAKRQAEVEKEYTRLVEKGASMQKGLVTAALTALPEMAAMPNEAGDLIAFLHKYLAESIEHDDYEFALIVAETLIDRETASDDVYLMAAQAAFCTNKHGLAQQYYEIARDKGVLDAGRFENVEKDTVPQYVQVARANVGYLDYYRGIWADEQEFREAEAADDDLPRVLMKTKHGDLVLELFENEAPNTVANFISLVEKGFYDGLTFHRVLPSFMAQGGCPQGIGTGGPGYMIACECDQPDHRKHFRGTLSMAHAGPNTGGSQFFITFVPTKQLDGMHTAFGRVIDGMDVLAKIKRRDTQQATAADRILKAQVIRKRDHDYVPRKMDE